ncbi:acyl-CoA thioesterase, partial [Acinetobacter baumannii]|uniref:acyl-CoA thioesterase n=1 Tax=Acinetobacter baumannii TaxID=470 RepID=UPI001CB84482
MPTLDEMTTVTDDQSELTMSVLMTPDMANFSGNVHGGTILKLLDQVAYACASRYSGSYVVTLSVDKVNFKEPIYVGELVTFLASVNHVGRTSMEVGICTLKHIAVTNHQKDKTTKNLESLKAYIQVFTK